MPEAGSHDVQAQLERMALMIGQLQLAVLALIDLAGRPAVQLQVEHLAVDRLAFEIGSIDVDQLSGEMNIGLTTIARAGSGVQGQIQDQARGQAKDLGTDRGEGQGPDHSRRQIWPPEQGGSSE